jgi:ribonuclease D
MCILYLEIVRYRIQIKGVVTSVPEDCKYLLIANQRRWEQAVAELLQVPRLAVDIEANGLFAYRERICLIQISTDSQNYILDPLAPISLEPLGDIFANPAIEKVFHAADFDLALLEWVYGWHVVNLFDTMRAARLLGFQKVGLAPMLESFYDVHLNKKYQKMDWGKRPLCAAMLAYACNDTCNLLRLRDDLKEKLDEKGLVPEAREIFKDLCSPRGPRPSFNPDDFWRIPKARDLEPRAAAILKAIFIYREKEAQRRDLPPFKVVNNRDLIRIARECAKWNGQIPKGLVEIPGVSQRLVDRFSPEFYKVIHKALSADPPVYVYKPVPHSDGYWQRHKLLKDWRKEIALRQKVESDAILHPKVLKEIAEKGPQTEEELLTIKSMGPCKRKRYGKKIIQLLKTEC